MFTPYDFQIESINSIFKYFKDGNKGNPLVVAPTGSGKSVIIACFCQTVKDRWPSQKILIVSHVKEILGQNYSAIKKQLKNNEIGLYSAGLKEKSIKDITIAGIHSIYNKPELFDNFDIIIVDECFAAGTKISTPYGYKKIEDIHAGDEIFNAFGTGIVESTFCKKTDKILTIKLSNGEKIECTENHKFFTTEGWIRASELENKRIICKKDVSSMQKILCPKDISNRYSKRKNVHKARMLLTILCKEIKEPNAQLRSKVKNGCHPKEDRTQTNSKRWEWNRWITHRKFSSQLLRYGAEWLAQRISCQNLCRPQKWSLSKLLQNRYSKSRIVNWIRVGWINTLWEEKSRRQKEKRLFGTIRVVNLSHKKQEGTRVVYDLQISGHPSYYANGCLVHNCHSIPNAKNGMYNKFFRAVQKPIIGFTATPFRSGTGYLHMGEKRLFDDIVYSIPIRKLQKEGYLCNLISKGTKRRMDANGIKKQAGDYIISELSKAFDREAVTKDIISELVRMKEKRKKWLAFAIDINHAEHITSELLEKGIKTACVHSKMNGDRGEIIKDFKAGEYQCLVSVSVLTTGFDAPDVDLIALLRPTASPNLHVQIIGRGLRIAPEKKDCLVLDFAGNLLRNGPIDNPIIKLKGKGTGEAIMKECPNCWEIVHAAVRVCPACGEKFQFKHHLSSQAKEREIISVEKWHEISDIKYFNYMGSRGIPMLKVSYFCGLRRFSEFVCLEHSGYAKYKAQFWWKSRSKKDPPESAQLALERASELKKPIKILVNEDGKYDSIKEVIFE